MKAAIRRRQIGVSDPTRCVCHALATVALAVAALASCHRASRSATMSLPSDGAWSRLSSDEPAPPRDVLSSYRRSGFLVAAGDVPFVGSVGYFAGPTDDTTLVLVAFSIPNRALTFTRDGERYRAAYDVVLEFLRDDALVRRELAHADVRVGSFKETIREEESIIFQQLVRLTPGPVLMKVSARDAGSTHTGTTQARLTVPRFTAGTMTPPVAVLRARPRQRRDAPLELVMSPRATSVFGRDSVAEFYIETYAAMPYAATPRLSLRVFDEGERVVFTDTVALPVGGESRRGALVQVPIARLGFGELTLVASTVAADSTTRETSARAPLLVTLGEGLAVSSFEQMVGYLRYFSTPERLRTLRDAAPPDRPRAWEAFLASTDPIPSTAENEAMRDYLNRLADANIRFREDNVPGWMTDRGMVFTSLGEPDHRTEPASADPMQRTHAEIWDYQRHRARFVFVDPTGFGRFRLTPNSEADYYALVRRLSR